MFEYNLSVTDLIEVPYSHLRSDTIPKIIRAVSQGSEASCKNLKRTENSFHLMTPRYSREKQKYQQGTLNNCCEFLPRGCQQKLYYFVICLSGLPPVSLGLNADTSDGVVMRSKEIEIPLEKVQVIMNSMKLVPMKKIIVMWMSLRQMRSRHCSVQLVPVSSSSPLWTIHYNSHIQAHPGLDYSLLTQIH